MTVHVSVRAVLHIHLISMGVSRICEEGLGSTCTMVGTYFHSHSKLVITVLWFLMTLNFMFDFIQTCFHLFDLFSYKLIRTFMKYIIELYNFL